MTEAELQEMTMALINDDSIFDIDEPPAPMDRAKEPVLDQLTDTVGFVFLIRTN